MSHDWRQSQTLMSIHKKFWFSPPRLSFTEEVVNFSTPKMNFVLIKYAPSEQWSWWDFWRTSLKLHTIRISPLEHLKFRRKVKRIDSPLLPTYVTNFRNQLLSSLLATHLLEKEFFEIGRNLGRNIFLVIVCVCKRTDETNDEICGQTDERREMSKSTISSTEYRNICLYKPN